MKTCELCGKEFEEGLKPNGFPKGMTLKGEDGETGEDTEIVLCDRCLAELLMELEKADALNENEKEWIKLAKE